MGAFSFELGKCIHPEVRERMVANLAQVDAELCRRVAGNLGLDTPKGTPAEKEEPSAALSQIPTAASPIDGRVVGVLAGDGVDRAGLEALRRAVKGAGATLYVIGPRGGTLKGKGGVVAVDRSALTTQSVEYDALIVAGGTSAEALAADPYAAENLGEAFRHHKTIGAWGEGVEVLDALSMIDAPGVVTAKKSDTAFGEKVIEAMGWHRHWDRSPSSRPDRAPA